MHDSNRQLLKQASPVRADTAPSGMRPKPRGLIESSQARVSIDRGLDLVEYQHSNYQDERSRDTTYQSRQGTRGGPRIPSEELEISREAPNKISSQNLRHETTQQTEIFKPDEERKSQVSGAHSIMSIPLQGSQGDSKVQDYQGKAVIHPVFQGSLASGIQSTGSQGSQGQKSMNHDLVAELQENTAEFDCKGSPLMEESISKHFIEPQPEKQSQQRSSLRSLQQSPHLPEEKQDESGDESYTMLDQQEPPIEKKKKMKEGVDLLLSSSKIRSNEEIESHLKSLSSKPYRTTISKVSNQDENPLVPTLPDEEVGQSSTQQHVEIVDQSALRAEDSGEFQSREMVLNIVEETLSPEKLQSTDEIDDVKPCSYPPSAPMPQMQYTQIQGEQKASPLAPHPPIVEDFLVTNITIPETNQGKAESKMAEHIPTSSNFTPYQPSSEFDMQERIPVNVELEALPLPLKQREPPRTKPSLKFQYINRQQASNDSIIQANRTHGNSKLSGIMNRTKNMGGTQQKILKMTSAGGMSRRNFNSSLGRKMHGLQEPTSQQHFSFGDQSLSLEDQYSKRQYRQAKADFGTLPDGPSKQLLQDYSVIGSESVATEVEKPAAPSLKSTTKLKSQQQPYRRHMYGLQKRGTPLGPPSSNEFSISVNLEKGQSYHGGMSTISMEENPVNSFFKQRKNTQNNIFEQSERDKFSSYKSTDGKSSIKLAISKPGSQHDSFWKAPKCDTINIQDNFEFTGPKKHFLNNQSLLPDQFGEPTYSNLSKYSNMKKCYSQQVTDILKRRKKPSPKRETMPTSTLNSKLSQEIDFLQKRLKQAKKIQQIQRDFDRVKTSFFKNRLNPELIDQINLNFHNSLPDIDDSIKLLPGANRPALATSLPRYDNKADIRESHVSIKDFLRRAREAKSVGKEQTPVVSGSNVTSVRLTGELEDPQKSNKPPMENVMIPDPSINRLVKVENTAGKRSKASEQFLAVSPPVKDPQFIRGKVQSQLGLQTVLKFDPYQTGLQQKEIQSFQKKVRRSLQNIKVEGSRQLPYAQQLRGVEAHSKSNPLETSHYGSESRRKLTHRRRSTTGNKSNNSSTSPHSQKKQRDESVEGSGENTMNFLPKKKIKKKMTAQDMKLIRQAQQTYQPKGRRTLSKSPVKPAKQ